MITSNNMKQIRRKLAVLFMSIANLLMYIVGVIIRIFNDIKGSGIVIIIFKPFYVCI